MTKLLRNLLIPLFAVCSITFAQTAPTTTTLTNALSARGTGGTTGTIGSFTITVGSTTGIYAPALNPSFGSIGSPSGPNITYLLIDKELLRVNTVPTTTTVGVERGVQGTKSVAHNASATVWILYPNMLLNSPPTGACTSTSFQYLPQYSYTDGAFYTCPTTGPNANLWSLSNSQNYQNLSDGSFFVPPSACWFINTTYTGTPAFLVLGASNVPVLNQTTNSTSGTETLTCWIDVPTRLTSNKGAVIKDITTYYGLQTTAITSVSTATLGTITFPVAAATETASTVTPVAAGGTITNTTVTSGLGTTTAGAFWSIKSTLGTPLAVTSDLTRIVFTLPFVSTNAGVLTLNTPGLQVHYNIDYF